MDALHSVEHRIGALTEVGLMLLALAIVVAILVGHDLLPLNAPSFG